MSIDPEQPPGDEQAIEFETLCDLVREFDTTLSPEEVKQKAKEYLDRM
jgi:hypothetical protein